MCVCEGRFEAAGSLGVSMLLVMTAWHIAMHAYEKLQHAFALCPLPLASLCPLPLLSWLGQ
jgi:divalent metal cation (Fe/Co/Zn/Cd) transporter